ncbi:uncharacterized protein [Littorina saxatilis]|uniref:uncharacterized protein isoform X2 n=1 Tax=Littorina saxatilis TaxID=31220 RepID=UPI0038B4415B
MFKRPIQEGAPGPLPSPTVSEDEDHNHAFSQQHSGAPSSPLPSDDLDYTSRLHRAILPMFIRHIPAAEFMDSPAISAVLTNQEMEQVHSKSETRGNSVAARCLLDYLKRKHNWFDRILETLDNPELKLQDFKARFAMERDKVNKEIYRNSRASSAQTTVKKGPFITTVNVQRNQSWPHTRHDNASLNFPHQAQQSPPVQSATLSPRPTVGHKMSSSQLTIDQISSTQLISSEMTSQPAIVQTSSAQPISGHRSLRESGGQGSQLPSGQTHSAQFPTTQPSLALDASNQPSSSTTRGSRAKEVIRHPKVELYHFFDDPHSLDKFRDVGETKHIIIDEQADKNEQVKYGLSKGTTTRFTSIVALVNYYSSHDIAVTRAGTCLLNPVSS